VRERDLPAVIILAAPRFGKLLPVKDQFGPVFDGILPEFIPAFNGIVPGVFQVLQGVMPKLLPGMLYTFPTDDFLEITERIIPGALDILPMNIDRPQRSSIEQTSAGVPQNLERAGITPPLCRWKGSGGRGLWG